MQCQFSLLCKNNAKTDMCLKHKWASTEKPPEKKVYKIAKRSEKRARQEKEYTKLAKDFLKNHPVCEYPACNQPSTTIHHMAGRISLLLCDVRYFKALCLDCHVFCENNPEKAKELGLSKSRLNKN